METYETLFHCSELRAKLGLKPLEQDDDGSKPGTYSYNV